MSKQSPAAPSALSREVIQKLEELTAKAADPAMFLDFAGILQHVPLGRATINRMISDGRFPKPDITYGAKIRLWRRETIAQWNLENGN